MLAKIINYSTCQVFTVRIFSLGKRCTSSSTVRLAALVYKARHRVNESQQIYSIINSDNKRLVIWEEPSTVISFPVIWLWMQAEQGRRHARLNWSDFQCLSLIKRGRHAHYNSWARLLYIHAEYIPFVFVNYAVAWWSLDYSCLLFDTKM